MSEAENHVRELGGRARAALPALARAERAAKDAALNAAARTLRETAGELIAANAADCVAAERAGIGAAFLDRLTLTPERIEGMAAALEAIAALPDPVGRLLDTTTRPNGLAIERVAVPIGVIGMIYESRPNVAADAGALCLKSGNAAILRGGSDSARSTGVIVAAMRAGLAAAGLPRDAVQAVGTPDRAAVAELLRGAGGAVDLVIPRGGKGLVALVQAEARVPTLLHLDGNCHSYVHQAADPAKALAVIRNAKLRRIGVCGATESILVDRAIAGDMVPALAEMFEGVCELRGDAAARALDPRILPASAEDWDIEYLDAIASVAVVDGLDEAVAWVNRHGSHHTDAILTEDPAAAKRFLAEVDSAIVIHNASTQFADGGEFGMGAEIGIATGRLHARGPVGLEQLTTYKYRVRGSGQTRP
ncbi:MAG: glutamate-5-semialdehyde dehydrogenase [Qipengyuania sp.]|nr:glutamate-5-semialdehyde dehydrogenase [Qipengyuania sp.]